MILLLFLTKAILRVDWIYFSKLTSDWMKNLNWRFWLTASNISAHFEQMIIRTIRLVTCYFFIRIVCRIRTFADHKYTRLAIGYVSWCFILSTETEKKCVSNQNTNNYCAALQNIYKKLCEICGQSLNIISKWWINKYP